MVTHVTFRSGGYNQVFVIWAVALVGLAAPILFLVAIGWPSDGLWLVAIWLVPYGTFLYLFAWRFALELELTEASLAWRGLLRAGEYPLESVREIRGARWHPYVAAMRMENGAVIELYLRRRGFLEFARELCGRAPDARLLENRMLRMADRSSLRSGLGSAGPGRRTR
jgi:hypothetical protein